MTRRDGLRRTEAFRRSRVCFQRFDRAIARRRGSHKRIEQMLRGMSDIIDGMVESCLVCLRRLRETTQLPDELKRRSANFIRCRRWTKVVKCFDGSAHVRTIDNSRFTINYFVFRPSRCVTYFAMQTFFGSVKTSAFAEASARQAPRFVQ